MNSAPAILSDINRLQTALVNREQGFEVIVKPLTRHYFSQGLYCREMAVPARTVLVGAMHKQDHMCLVLKGKCKIVSEELTEIVEAPFMYASKAGAKRAIYAYSDLVWVTAHATEETNIETLEQTLVE